MEISSKILSFSSWKGFLHFQNTSYVKPGKYSRNHLFQMCSNNLRLSPTLLTWYILVNKITGGRLGVALPVMKSLGVNASRSSASELTSVKDTTVDKGFNFSNSSWQHFIDQNLILQDNIESFPARSHQTFPWFNHVGCSRRVEYPLNFFLTQCTGNLILIPPSKTIVQFVVCPNKVCAIVK